MAKKKIVEETTETPAEVAEVVNASESAEKTAFRALIEAYKVQNPAKYEVKKDELIKQLNNLN